MFNLTGKVALVAGGAGYLGTPICRGLAEQGASVVVADLSRQRMQETARTVCAAVPEARVKCIPFDVASEESVRSAVQQTVSAYGGLHILINATCMSVGKLVEEIAPAEFDTAMHINLTGAFMLAREAAAAMKTGGSIIMFSSMYGQVSPDPRVYDPPMKPNPIEYGVAKAGIIQMVRYLAVSWGPRGIRVNAIAPGPFPNTDVQRDHPAFVQRLAGKTPLGRVGRADETAGAVVFLAGDDSSYITGQTIAVNGGWTAW